MAKKGKNKQCVAIAKDVLSQLRLEKYVARSGTYLCGKTDSNPFGNFPPGDLQKIMKKNKIQPCEVCAIGSMFLSTIRKYDAFETRPILTGYDYVYGSSDSISPDEMKVKLRQFFTPTEVHNIERDFERGISRIEPLEEDNDILVFIMKEIIRQEGNYSSYKAHIQAQSKFNYYGLR